MDTRTDSVAIETLGMLVVLGGLLTALLIIVWLILGLVT